MYSKNKTTPFPKYTVLMLANFKITKRWVLLSLHFTDEGNRLREMNFPKVSTQKAGDQTSSL